MKPIIFLLGVSLHFGIILWNNFQHSYYAYYRTRQEEPRALTDIVHIGQHVFQYSILRVYAKLSGNDMPYGFFAPNIGSQYVTEFRLYNNRDSLRFTLGNPKLKNRESLNRYSSFTRLFESLLKEADRSDKPTNLEQAYSRAVAYSMARYLGKSDPNISQVKVSIYLYQEHDSLAQDAYFLIFQRTINL
uniref:Uncharacterized protein n=1 Tax=Sphingobacterium sp. (strain 21) TaxID=743722 RepID=F4C990_SPHS2